MADGATVDAGSVLTPTVVDDGANHGLNDGVLAVAIGTVAVSKADSTVALPDDRATTSELATRITVAPFARSRAYQKPIATSGAGVASQVPVTLSRREGPAPSADAALKTLRVATL
jgi:hypothetical protein